MRAASTVSYHFAIASNWPVRNTKWANLAGWIGWVAGASRRIGAGEPDQTRAEPPPQRQAEPVAIECDRALEIGDLDIGVDLDHPSPSRLIGVIRLAAVEEALEGREMVVAGGLPAIARRVGVL